jgi:membrane protein DedA with SNARE-associated domain
MRAPRSSSGVSGRIGEWLDHWGVWASFGWGVAEATLFFIVPDVIVGAVGLFRRRRALASVAAAIAGAVVGGFILYVAARGAGEGLRSVIEQVPGVRAETMARVRGDLEAHGGTALVLGPFSGIPYKIYAGEWGLRGWGLPALLAWTVPARAIRILPVALLAAGAGFVLRRWLYRWPEVWLGLYALSWVAVYVLYFRANGF